ncbi:hypothetical protein SLA2020_125600 [Shorea laevis]
MEGEKCSPWPFRIKLTRDHLRWDSLKISPLKEFEERIISILEEDNRKALDAGRPIQVQMYDIDTNETYEVNLVKKQAFWFEPFPDIGQKPEKRKGEQFAYSLEPFKHIAKKRDLSCGMEIGIRQSDAKTSNKLEFSILYAAKLHLRSWEVSRTY